MNEVARDIFSADFILIWKMKILLGIIHLVRTQDFPKN